MEGFLACRLAKVVQERRKSISWASFWDSTIPQSACSGFDRIGELDQNGHRGRGEITDRSRKGAEATKATIFNDDSLRGPQLQLSHAMQRRERTHIPNLQAEALEAAASGSIKNHQAAGLKGRWKRCDEANRASRMQKSPLLDLVVNPRISDRIPVTIQSVTNDVYQLLSSSLTLITCALRETRDDGIITCLLIGCIGVDF